MDNAATLSLWDDDGTSLLPNAPPIVGKTAIKAFLTKVTAGLRSAHMQAFEFHCHDAVAYGNIAAEWCDEHQVVPFGADRQPFDGRGPMLLVLHRDQDGRWRLQREMWQPADAAN